MVESAAMVLCSAVGIYGACESYGVCRSQLETGVGQRGT